MDVEVSSISALPDDIDGLAMSSRHEGFGHVDRLIDDFASGANVFAEPGEALFEARAAGRLVGIGGLNRDPFHAGGRVRRVYVAPDARRHGVGRRLMQAIERAARSAFAELNLYTGNDAAACFYERLGYARVDGFARLSHRKRLR